MASALNYIDDLLNIYHDETVEGLVDVSPSRLTRGQGTEKKFYILKIDLVGSTVMLGGTRKPTYLRLAHTFLSTVDKITQDYGADPEQTEYAGDSVLAYFPENTTAEKVLVAACYSRMAVVRIGALNGAVGALKPKCKTVIHFAPLIVAKIGPRAGSFISAIGHPIHRVAHIEKDITPDIGRTTVEFYKQLNPQNRKFLSEVYTVNQVQVPSFHRPVLDSVLRPRSLADILYNTPTPAITPPPHYRTEKVTIGYNLNWMLLNTELGLV